MCLLCLTKGSPWKKCNVVLLAVIDDEVRFTVCETVTVFNRYDCHNLAATLDMLSSYIRECYMTDLALLPQPSQRFHRSLEGYCIVRSVKLIDVDAVQAQAFQASFQSLCEMFWTGIVSPLVGARAFPSAFCCDNQTSWIGIEGFRDQLLRDARTIGVCSVNQVYIEFNCPSQCCNRSGFICVLAPYARACDAHRTITQTVHCE